MLSRVFPSCFSLPCFRRHVLTWLCTLSLVNFLGSVEAMSMMLRSLTGEDWYQIMWDAAVSGCHGNLFRSLTDTSFSLDFLPQVAPPYCEDKDCGEAWLSILYFFSFTIIVPFIFLNVFIGTYPWISSPMPTLFQTPLCLTFVPNLLHCHRSTFGELFDLLQRRRYPTQPEHHQGLQAQMEAVQQRLRRQCRLVRTVSILDCDRPPFYPLTGLRSSQQDEALPSQP